MLEATRANNVSLNSKKLQFKHQSVNFFGHTLTQDGILSAADKLEALKSISAPSNTKKLLSLLELITYLNRFSAKVAELTAPLRELTKKNVHFRWEQHHQAALDGKRNFYQHRFCLTRTLIQQQPPSHNVMLASTD